MPPKPYIGITGFMDRTEVEHILQDILPAISRRIMIGVLATLNTLRGRPAKRPNRYPPVQRIRDIFTDHPAALNLIHYATDGRDTLADQLLEMTEAGGPRLHGFQLNIAWPDPDQLWRYLTKHPDKMIVLQVGGRAFEAVRHSPERLAQKLADEYYGLIDHVLLDLSGGHGRPLDAGTMGDFLRAVRAGNRETGLGIAGGLGPESVVSILDGLPGEFPDLCVDAEGRLRDENDDLDLGRAGAYLWLALQLFDAV